MTARQIEELLILPAIERARALQAEMDEARGEYGGSGSGGGGGSRKKTHTLAERIIEECYDETGKPRTDAEMDARMVNWMRGAGGVARMKPERFKEWVERALRDDRAARVGRRERAAEALSMQRAGGAGAGYN